MNEAASLIRDPAGVLTVLTGIAAVFFFLEQRFHHRLFSYFPPLLFIYGIPVVLSNTGVLPSESPIYDGMRRYGLPFFLTILLLDVNLGGAIRVMGKGVLVMLMGSLGVVVGAPMAFLVVHRHLGPEAWKGYGALAGSWIGGTGNMAAVAEGLGTPGDMFGLAVLTDNVIYLVWLPILLASRNWASRFATFTGVSHGDCVRRLEAAAGNLETKSNETAMRHLVYLGFLGFAVTWISVAFGDIAAAWLTRVIPAPVLEMVPIVSASTITVLTVTTLGIGLSYTPARRIPGSHGAAMAVVYLFVAVMGARASLAGFSQALPFVAGGFIWIFIHGVFCLLGARLCRVDIHTAAIASAANIGGAASAPVVAGYHNEKLVPASILMALIGYAIGNYAAFLAAQLCYLAGRL